jgi:hypothetical protein
MVAFYMTFDGGLEVTNMAADFDVVGRVREYHLRASAVEQTGKRT